MPKTPTRRSSPTSRRSCVTRTTFASTAGRSFSSTVRPFFEMQPQPAERWREHCRRRGLPDPYLVTTEAFETPDPRAMGYDAAVEFPPNTSGRELPPRINPQLTFVNPSYAGAVYRYTDMMLLDREPVPYQRFKGVCCGFDNEPRRPGNGSTYAFATPAAYGRWLEAACRSALAEPNRDKRLVFINAWNEWAEGAHLEPDRRFGYAYLGATARALEALAHPYTILFVSHDACRGGAQLVLLDFLAWLRAHTSLRIKVLCLEGGEWLERFEAIADTALRADLELRAQQARERDLTHQLLDFCGGHPALVYGNSVASGRIYSALRKLRAPIVTHFHELETSIERYAGGWMSDIAAYSSHHIACSEAVRDNLVASHGIARTLISTVYSSIRESGTKAADPAERLDLRRQLGLVIDKRIVMGCGIGMPFRKGADLFIAVGNELRKLGAANIHLYWVGEFPADETDPLHGRWADRLADVGADSASNVTFLGLKSDPMPYLRAADVFLLTSREDPFPLAALEAAACGAPIVCFEGAGGMPEFVKTDAGVVVPFEDVAAAARSVIELVADEAVRESLGNTARQQVLSRFTTGFTAPHLLSVCRSAARQKPAVSVIVPNYNHARYLPERLASIFGQTFKDVEVILLDDASTDGSLDVLEQHRDRADVRIVRNENNSGSTFQQWLKGLDLARADIVWIAESDDRSDPEFVTVLLEAMRDPGVKVAYADSYVIDADSRVVGDYTSTEYLTSLSRTKWTRDYEVSAEREINDGLGVKNTILSASSVMFRKFELPASARQQLEGMKVAGDWYFFIHAMAGGNVFYTPRKLNYHRRHQESVVGKLLKDNRVGDFFREFYAVQCSIFEQYPLDGDFETKWERYLRDQWKAFFPDRPFDELAGYYPLERAKDQIRTRRSTL